MNISVSIDFTQLKNAVAQCDVTEKLELLQTEIVNVVVASTVKTYATFLVWLSISLASPSLVLSGLR